MPKQNLRIIVRYIGSNDPMIYDTIKKIENSSLNATYTDITNKSFVVNTNFLTSVEICSKIIRNILGSDWIALPEVI
jgi:hypothetical protein